MQSVCMTGCPALQLGAWMATRPLVRAYGHLHNTPLAWPDVHTPLSSSCPYKKSRGGCAFCEPRSVFALAAEAAIGQGSPAVEGQAPISTAAWVSPHSRTWCLRPRGLGIGAEEDHTPRVPAAMEFQVKWIPSAPCRCTQVHVATQAGMATFSNTGFGE